MDEIARTTSLQAGVISRRQLHELGVPPSAIERGLRRRDLTRLLPGVFVDHTGPTTWLQRAWAGVLYYWPAALSGQSALRVVAGPGWRHHEDAGAIHVAVTMGRRARSVPGYSVRRMAALDQRVMWNTSPPRVRPETACLQVADGIDDQVGRIGLLADLCQTRTTSAQRLIAAMDAQARVRDRVWLRSVLVDIRDGTCSVLEHGYLTRVERPHRLPRGARQGGAITAQGRVLRDVVYAAYNRCVELDGRMFHDSARQRDGDLDRDLDAALTGTATVRLGWGQVYARPCRTAARIGQLLQQGGWAGTPHRCGPACAI